jgi:DNA-binding response OmpR family regulator
VPDTVLVVDDDPVILKLLEVNFEMEGFVVRTAADGQEALESALADVPDVIVSDVMMPRLDGIGLVRALRADEATRDVPVLLLSAKAQSADIKDGMAAGADDYLTKPFEPLELIDHVAKLLQRS